MATLKRSCDFENELTIFTAVGRLEAEQVAKEVVSFLSGAPTMLVLWNVTAADLGGLSNAGMRMILEQASPFAHKRRGGRTAILCASDLDFGISRVFQALAEITHVPFEIEVFRTESEARAWLDEIKKDFD